MRGTGQPTHLLTHSGIGLLAIEAAALQSVTAISLDLDQQATDAAAANAAAAARCGALRGSVETLCTDALRLGTAGEAVGGRRRGR